MPLWFGCDVCFNGPQVDYCKHPATGCPFGYLNDGSNCCQPWIASASCTTPGINGTCPAPTVPNGSLCCLARGDAGCAALGLFWDEAGQVCSDLLGGGGFGDCLDPVMTFDCGKVVPEMNCPYEYFTNGACFSPVLIDLDGNSDGVLDGRDAVFAYLRLWRDCNHDGVSQPEELHTLPALDVARLHFDYKESKKKDAYGNEFRYRAKVDDAKGAKAGRWAWDVFLVTGQ
ncbi:MAG TPA: hypothetical protein VF297_31445 [Pyrinomonadaceae bacterium]